VTAARRVAANASTRATSVPRAPVVVRAAYVSQETCRELLGIDARRYLELLVPLCRGDVALEHLARLVLALLRGLGVELGALTRCHARRRRRRGSRRA
jgi:hypothetical protein